MSPGRSLAQWDVELWVTGRDVAVAAFPGAHLRLSLLAKPGTEQSSALLLCCCFLLGIPQVLSCRALSFWWVPPLWLPLCCPHTHPNETDWNSLNRKQNLHLLRMVLSVFSVLTHISK